jgi:hypothetical protein
VAGDEPVTSPDQHRPTVSKRLARLGVVLTIIILVAMTFGNHEGQTETVWLVGLAAFLFLMLIGDFILRRNGLKND